MSFPDEPGAILPLPWRATRSQLKPDANDGHRFPAVFAVGGRQAEQHFVEFGGPFPGIDLCPQDYSVRIEARLGHKSGWQPLLTFVLRAAHIIEPGPFITYSNSPFDLTPDTVEKSTRALRQLMETLDTTRAFVGRPRAPDEATTEG